MNKEELLEKWEEVCFHLSDDIRINMNENVYEQKVLLVFEKLGWSSFKREIQFQPSLPVDSQKSITPDIVIYSPGEKAAIVVEIKRPNQKVTGVNFIDQLKSYMRQAKTDFGLFIGNEIHIFYDGNLNPFPDPIHLCAISLQSHSKGGTDFIDLFYRDHFTKENYLGFIKETVARLEKEQKIQKLREELTSGVLIQKVREFLIAHFSRQSFDQDIIEGLMDTMNIEITYKRDPTLDEDHEKTIQVCKNRVSEEHFVYIGEVENGLVKLILPNGDIGDIEKSFFEEPQEGTVEYYSNSQIVNELQIKRWIDFEPQAEDDDQELEHVSHNVLNNSKKVYPNGCTVDGIHYNFAREAIAALRRKGKIKEKDVPIKGSNAHVWLSKNQIKFNYEYVRDN